MRFLSVWEAILLVHTRGKGIVREEHRPILFSTKTPHSLSTFLVDGTVAGTWRYESGRVDVTPFEPPDQVVAREVRAEAEALAAFHR